MTDWGFLVDEAYESIKESKNSEEKQDIQTIIYNEKENCILYLMCFMRLR